MNKSESIQNLSAALSKAQAEMPELFSKLSEPFPSEAIDWRVGATNSDKSKGIALAYLQARPVMDRLDEAIGPENWTDVYTPIQGKDGVVGFLCTLSLKIGDNWISKMDGADTSDIEAIKGGISDAFKRAAVKWGVGRYLYDLPNIWVPVETRGKSFVLKETPKLPDWALPKKKIKSKAENPDPMTDFLVETFAVDAPSKVEADIMTIERAMKIQNSKGVSYGDIPSDTLQKMVIGINKGLKNGVDDEKRAEYLEKKQAIGVILKARANKEI